MERDILERFVVDLNDDVVDANPSIPGDSSIGLDPLHQETLVQAAPVGAGDHVNAQGRPVVVQRHQETARDTVQPQFPTRYAIRIQFSRI